MKHRFPILLLLAAAIGPASAPAGTAQTIIDDLARPESPNPDRKVELREVFRITDDGNDFYFKYPYHIAVGPDDSIYILEQQQLLRFDQNGKYVRNYFKFGQGPGEMQFVWGFVPTEQGLLVHGSPDKMMVFDEAGAFIKETPLAAPHKPFSFEALSEGQFIFSARENIFEILQGSGPTLVPVPNYILTWKEGRDSVEPHGAFDVPTMAFRPESLPGVSTNPWCDFLFVPIGSGRVLISHTPEYLLKIFDLKSGAVVKSFRRPYDRIRYVPRKPSKKALRYGGGAVKEDPNQKKYAADIAQLYAVGDRIWVRTSTVDKAQNPVIDVYDFDGRYLDRFTLVRPEGKKRQPTEVTRSAIRGIYFYAIEKDDEDSYSIVKYEIVGAEGKDVLPLPPPSA